MFRGPLSQAHKEAVSRGLKRYYADRDLATEKEWRENVTRGVRKRYETYKPTEEHKSNISKGTRMYYESNDGPWSQKSFTDKHMKNISKGLRKYWKRKKQQRNDYKEQRR